MESQQQQPLGSEERHAIDMDFVGATVNAAKSSVETNHHQSNIDANDPHASFSGNSQLSELTTDHNLSELPGGEDRNTQDIEAGERRPESHIATKEQTSFTAPGDEEKKSRHSRQQQPAEFGSRLLCHTTKKRRSSTSKTSKSDGSGKSSRDSSNSNTSGSDEPDDDEYESSHSVTYRTSGKKSVVVIKTTEEKLREAERVIATEIYNTNTIPADLSTWSAAAAFFQLTQAMILCFLAMEDTGKWYWFVSYPDPSNEELYDSSRIPESKEVAKFSVLWLVPLVPLLSALEHLCCIVFRESYEYYIARHQNPFRWTEYTFSASLMKVLIGQQVGVTDVHLLVGMFILMAISIQCAAMHEAMNAKARSEDRPQYWRAFFTGWIGHLANWALIVNYFSVFTSRGGDPRVIWALLISQFILDTSFAIVFTLQWKKVAIFKNYVVGEKGFICLSFTAKTILIWLTVINTMQY